MTVGREVQGGMVRILDEGLMTILMVSFYVSTAQAIESLLGVFGICSN